MSARRISHRRAEQLSERVQTSDVQELIKDCGSAIHGGRRVLSYRRLRGMDRLFQKGGEWPLSTDIACWYCRLPFDSVPVPVVEGCTATEFDVYGVCCSPACSKSYLAAQSSNNVRTRLMWQKKMLVEVFGWPPEAPVPLAKPWQALAAFGGYMTVEEYRAQTPGVTAKLVKPPFIPFKVMIETEQRGGEYVVDQTRDFVAPPAAEPTLEQQAREHGSTFDLSSLKRPPEDEVVATEAQLAAKHPLHDLARDRVSPVFDKFMQSAAVPTEDMCASLRDAWEARRKAVRKVKGEAVSETSPGHAKKKKLVPFDTPSFDDPFPVHPGPPAIPEYTPVGPFQHGPQRAVRFSDRVEDMAPNPSASPPLPTALPRRPARKRPRRDEASAASQHHAPKRRAARPASPAPPPTAPPTSPSGAAPPAPPGGSHRRRAAARAMEQWKN